MNLRKIFLALSLSCSFLPAIEAAKPQQVEVNKKYHIKAAVGITTSVFLAGGGVVLTVLTGGVAAPVGAFLLKLSAGCLLGSGISSGISTSVKRYKKQDITLKEYIKEAGIGGLSGMSVAGAAVGVAAAGLSGIGAAATAGSVGGATGGVVRGGLEAGIEGYQKGDRGKKLCGDILKSACKKGLKGAIIGAATGSAASATVIPTSNLLEAHHVAIGVEKTVDTTVGVLTGGASGGATGAAFEGITAKKGERKKAAMKGAIAGALGGAVVGGVIGMTTATHVHEIKKEIKQSWEKSIDTNPKSTDIKVSDMKVHLKLNGDVDIHEHVTYKQYSEEDVPIRMTVDANQHIGHDGTFSQDQSLRINESDMKESLTKSWEKAIASDPHSSDVKVSNVDIQYGSGGSITINEHVTYHQVDHRNYDVTVTLDAHHQVYDGQTHTSGTVNVQGTDYVKFLGIAHGKDVNITSSFSDEISPRIDISGNVIGIPYKHHVDLPAIKADINIPSTLKPDIDENTFAIGLAALANPNTEKICTNAKDLGTSEVELTGEGIAASAVGSALSLGAAVTNWGKVTGKLLHK